MTCHVARRMGDFERRLRRERRDVCQTLAAADAELVGREPHHPGESSDDAATETSCRLLARLEERDRRVLEEIDAAEERLATGSFGVCEVCGQPISFERLRALPEARRCISCEETAKSPMTPGASAPRVREGDDEWPS
jgi:DnaK suppressor protein